jgi:tetratricopeptide (TPR) repeat protein
MPKQIIDSKWFSYFDLACASASCLIWYFLPGSGWWPLLLGLVPWALRLSSGFFPFKRTPFDLALFLFLLTAGIGVWASYDPPAAWDKFWLIVGSILLFYALAGQPVSNLWPIYGLVGVIGAMLAFATLFDPNYGKFAPDMGLFQPFSQWWQATRPDWQVNALAWNVSGGLLAALLPFPLALAGRSFWVKKARHGTVVLILSLFMLVGLALSGSRGAWIAFVAALVGALLWLGYKFIPQSLSRAFRISFVIVLLLTLGIVVGLFITSSGGLEGALGKLMGWSSMTSRVDLIRETSDLIADFPFTGGGLQAYPGLYSRYIRVIPFLFYQYSYNLYLDVFLEQGLLGGVTLVIVLFGSLLLAASTLVKTKVLKSEALLQLAATVSLIVIVVHGFLGDAFYSTRGTPLLFLAPGIGLALRTPGAVAPVKTGQKSPINWRKLLWVSAILIILVIAAFGQSGYMPLTASWYANLGSVYQAKAELYDYPSGSFAYSPEEGPLEQAKGYFKRALMFDPQNVTANYRMGIIASDGMDFQAAIPYLETAFQWNESHRGIQKVLGYNYAWTAQPELAAEMLAEIPEARGELDVYVWWWGTQGRADLSANAQTTLSLMNEQSY